jgi:hypothetical protein
MTKPGPWRSAIEGLASDAEFATGATAERISATEEALGVSLPEELRSLLLESDGVRADNCADVIWSCAELVKQNIEFRSFEDFRDLYMPFDNLLFIGADGGGDQFAYAIAADGRIPNNDIYCWDHETDGRPWFSGHLIQYLERRLSPSYYEDL